MVSKERVKKNQLFRQNFPRRGSNHSAPPLAENNQFLPENFPKLFHCLKIIYRLWNKFYIIWEIKLLTIWQFPIFVTIQKYVSCWGQNGLVYRLIPFPLLLLHHLVAHIHVGQLEAGSGGGRQPFWIMILRGEPSSLKPLGSRGKTNFWKWKIFRFLKWDTLVFRGLSELNQGT